MAHVSTEAQAAVRRTEPWLRLAARLGYLSKGVVYAAVGLLALLAATGHGGRAADPKDAVNFLADLPFGSAIVAVIGVSLLALALWRLLQAIRNPEGRNAFRRVAEGFAALVYSGLGVAAIRAATGERDAGGASSTAAAVLERPGGQAALVLGGVVLFVLGGVSLVKAAKSSFLKNMRTESMEEHERRVATVAGRVGYAARGVVFLLSGLFVARAGLSADPNEAGGVEESLRTLARSPFGPWLLGAAAFGLLAYACFQALEAKYHRMEPAPKGV